MSRGVKAAIGLGSTFIVVLLIAVWFISGMISRSLPVYSGQFTGAPVKGTVEIYRDSLAVPSIFADNSKDAAFAIGFLHAQERLFQMDLARRIAEGRLSEILGSETVPFDLMFRTLGIKRISEKALGKMDPQSLALIESYAEGVNFYLSGADNSIPIEFAILGYEPEAWEPLHSVEMVKLMAWQMSSHWFIKMAYIQLQEKLGTTAREILLTKDGRLYPEYRERLPEYTAPIDTLDEIVPYTQEEPTPTQPEMKTKDTITTEPEEDTVVSPVTVDTIPAVEEDTPVEPESPDTNSISALFGDNEYNWLTCYASFLNYFNLQGSMKGSNNWAIGGSRTVSGKPLIANDPHLPFIAPNIWYAVVIESGEWNAAGLTLPGLPLIVIGKNEHIAWSVTNGHLDDIDFYREQIDSSGRHYLLDDKWEPLTIVKDTIDILDDKPQAIALRYTHRGPLITGSHLFNVMYEETFQRTDEISMRWTGAEPGDDILAFYRLNIASGWDGFLEALEGYTAPSQNFVYTDDAGNIGYVYAGKIPLRPVEDPPLLFEGSTTASDWQGFLSFDRHPVSFNPAEGWFGTANNQPAGYEGYLARFWSPPSRIDRIYQLLQGKEKHSLEDCMRYQLDQVSPYAERVVPLLLNAFNNITITDPNLRKSLEILASWKYDLSPYLQASAIYEVFLTHLMLNTFRDEMGEDLFGAFSFIRQAPYLTLLRLLESGNAPFFDDMSTPEKETRDDMLRKSLVDALIELEKNRGGEIQTWMWGEMHPLTIKHPFSGVSSVVDDLVNIGPYGVGGDGTTLYNTEYAFQNDLSITEGKPYQTVLGPTMRFIYDFSTPGFFYLALSTGQSGHIFSDNYDNFTPLYLEGKYAKIHTNPTHIKQNHKNLIIISRY